MQGLDTHQGEVLLQVTRQIYPHATLDDAVYALVVKDLDAKAKADPAVRQQLADGVNLGNLTSGPIWEQANKVLQAINEKNRIVHGRFRGILLLGDPYWNTAAGQKRRADELALRLEQVKEAQAEVNKLAAPKPRKFEIKPAK